MLSRAAAGLFVLLGLVSEAGAGLAEAEGQLAKGDYRSAEATLRGIGGRDRARADLLLGRLYLDTGRYPEARDAAVRAARSAPLRTAAETLRGEALRTVGDRQGAIAAWQALWDRPEARRARLLLGRAYTEADEVARARACFEKFVEEYNANAIAQNDGESLAYVGAAVYALGAFRDATEAFGDAARASPARAETHREWAALFLEKYDAGHAEEAIADALRQNPNDAESHVLYARIKMRQNYDFSGAQEEIDKALETNPNLVSAHALRAELAVMDNDYQAADGSLRTALAINPSDVDALSVAAASAFIQDDRQAFERAKARVLSVSPRNTRLFHAVARVADWEHRYDEVIALMGEALRVDPDDLYAHSQIGINRLRMGEEDAGLQALRESFERDRYNVQVFNTLNFFENVVRKQYVWARSRSLRVRMHSRERAVLERYVPQMLERAWASMVRRYGFSPSGPVAVEMFADEEHFAVRTTGLPNIGVQGVCFGKVVTALSPTGGPFNWGQILWHELGHVFSIQLSRARVPRWLTEGLAEYEAMTARPEWQRENDDDLYRAIEAGRLPGVRGFTQAFTHASSGDDVLVAYYASSMVVKHLVERHGFDKVLDILRRYGRGDRTEDIFPAVLGMSTDDFDREFRAATMQRLVAFGNNYRVVYAHYPDLEARKVAAQVAPRDAQALARLAAAQVFAGQARDAYASAEAALAIEPRTRMALFIKSDLAVESRNLQAAKQAAEALIATGVDSYEMRLNLARAAEAARDRVALRRHLEAAVRLDPSQREPHDRLGQLAAQEHRDDDELGELLAIARLDQHDRELYRTLIEKLASRGRWQDVRRFGEMALYLDPLSADVHTRLARAYEQLGMRSAAIFELDTALLCEGRDEAAIRSALARVRAGSSARAR